MKKVKIKISNREFRMFPFENDEIYEISDECFVDGCYELIFTNGDRYNVYKEWCIEIPDFTIDLPEDLFDL